jgi:hypothetical protein
MRVLRGMKSEEMEESRGRNSGSTNLTIDSESRWLSLSSEVLTMGISLKIILVIVF